MNGNIGMFPVMNFFEGNEKFNIFHVFLPRLPFSSNNKSIVVIGKEIIENVSII